MKYLLWILLCLPLCAQDRMVTHLTRVDGTFETRILLHNTGDMDGSAVLVPYDAAGTPLSEVEVQVLAGEKIETEAFSLLGNQAASHFRIVGDERIAISVSYRAAVAGASPAHVTAFEEFSERWFILPGNWALAFDAIAVVNLGGLTTPVRVIARNASGEEMASVELTGALGPNAKTLAVLSDLFASLNADYFEIQGDEPLSVLALRGSLDSVLLWGNAPLPGQDSVSVSERLVAHVTTLEGGFESNVIALNTGDSPANLVFTAFDADGLSLPSIGREIGAGELLLQDVHGFFDQPVVSHFSVEGPAFVRSGVTYRARDGMTSPAFAAENANASEQWLHYRGDWDVAFDAFAAVNTGDAPADLQALRYDAGGALQEVRLVAKDLAAGEKALFVTSTAFQDADAEGFFAIGSNQPMALTALRGNLGSTLLWRNDAVTALPPNRLCELNLSYLEGAPRLTDLVYTGTEYLALGGQVMMRSLDGVFWDVATMDLADYLIGLAWNGTRYVAVGNSGSIYTSTDGKAWEKQSSNTLRVLVSVVDWQDGRFVAVGERGSVLTSTDGLSWALGSTGTTRFLMDLVWTGASFVAVGEAGVVALSEDGLEWQTVDTGAGVMLRGIAMGSSGLVAVGDGGTVAVSADGEAWNVIQLENTGVLRDVAWDGTQYWLCGDSGFLAISADGINWQTVETCTDQTIRHLQWQDGRLIAVGDNGLVLWR